MNEFEVRAFLTGEGFTRHDFEVNKRNYLIEAGAGAGKTTIMVGRIVNQLVTAFREPEELVAITFTNKSTLELRTRLDEALLDRRRQAQEASPVDQALLERLDYLIRESGRMQVSTIHSFCQTMLEAMPFSSPLGMDMQVEENEEEAVRAFLQRRMREDRNLFRRARDMGADRTTLENFFRDRCSNGEAEIVFCKDPVKIAGWEKDTRDSVIRLHATLYKEAQCVSDLKKYLDADLRRVITMDPAAFAADQKARDYLTEQVLRTPDKLPLRNEPDYRKRKKFRTDSGMKLNAAWCGEDGHALRAAAGLLLHSLIMGDLVPLLAQYRAEKQRRHIATFDDLLLRTRDMLRSDAQARTFFHRRYKTLYVDEMQDTDPVQTELLFYLTTDEKDFDASDWRRCRPVPGSLFLVGDPKQAIYRFRGADIGVYNTLLELFQSEEERLQNGPDSAAVGEKVTLCFNFRSAAEVCALTDRVFAPNGTQSTIRFTGGTYHARYVSMEARSGPCELARLVRYTVGGEKQNEIEREDARRVAAFIHTMIQKNLQVGLHDPDHKKFRHAARPGDFLILTARKQDAQRYADALESLGISAEVSGERQFSSLPAVNRLKAYLHFLCAPRDDLAALQVLRVCYGLEQEETLRKLMVRSGIFSLTRLVSLEKLAGIRLALEAEQPQDAEMLTLCAALGEMARLKKLVRTLPAMAAIEMLAESFVWRGIAEEEARERQALHAQMQQYLNQVRKSRERSFPALAQWALECAEKSYERALPLAQADDAVRIMNLHKAKGLEGEVVILAAGWQREITPVVHVERRGGIALEHAVVQVSKGYGGRETIAWPENWEKSCSEERKFLEAEYARLLYVAATRAKTMLVAYGDPGIVVGEKFSYWQSLADWMVPAHSSDPQYGPAFEALNAKKPAGTAPGQNQAAPPPVKTPLQPEGLEAALKEDATTLTESRFYAITPSRLEKAERTALRPKDNEEPETAGESLPSEVNVLPDEAGGPCGPVWGTMVHRVMELAVIGGDFTKERILAHARESIREALEADLLDGRQRKLLGLSRTDGEEEIVSALAPPIAGAAAFLCDAASPLRRLMEGAESYPELPFVLRAGEEDANTREIYRHLCAHISSDAAKDRTLAVEGVIDLALYKDGGWYVVDYKTDKLRPGESRQDLIRRLKAEYTPQITAYARVLGKMQGEKRASVRCAWLCSIPLGGELIPLEIDPVSEGKSIWPFKQN